MLKNLAGNYQNFKPDDNPDQSVAYRDGLKRMVKEFGQFRTQAAVIRACDIIPDFVPTIGKIREFAPPADGVHQTCTVCHPDGWITVYSGKTANGNTIDPTRGAVVRCNHRSGKSPVTEAYEGQGYGMNDVVLLAKMRQEFAEKYGHQPDDLLPELDRRTGRV